MALAIGTNSGFVTTAPTSNPSGTPNFITIGGTELPDVTHDTSPANAGKITEVGWWVDGATNAADWKIALYAADGGVVPGEAGTRLFITSAQAKGTTLGWKKVTVDWDIDASTSYWLGVWLSGGTTTYDDYSPSGGTGWDDKSGTLSDPFDAGAINDADAMVAVYAVVEEAPPGFTRKIKISGTFQDKPIKTKVAGTFQDKPIKIKVGGTFQDA